MLILNISRGATSSRTPTKKNKTIYVGTGRNLSFMLCNDLFVFVT